jgi:hypothetical protein
MMSSANARPENAELERRVKRRLQRLQRKRCPPSSVVPSFVTLSELHRGHDIDLSSYAERTHPTLLQENPAVSLKGDLALRLLDRNEQPRAIAEIESLSAVARAALHDMREVAQDAHRVSLASAWVLRDPASRVCDPRTELIY